MFHVLLHSVVPIYLAIGLGYLISRRMQMELDPLNTMVLYLFAPCLIYDSLASKPLDPSLLVLVSCIIGAMIVIQSLIYLGLIKIFERPEMRGGSLAFCFGNTGAINLPLCFLAFGEDGLRVAILVLVVTALLHYSLGIYVVQPRKAGLELIKSPLLYAAIAGVLVGYSGWKPPEFLTVTIEMLGKATIPLLLILLGFQLSETPLTQFGQGGLVALGRSAIGIAIVWPIVWVLDLPFTTTAVLVLSASMPPAITNFMIARRYDANPELNAGAIMVGTFLAIGFSSLLIIYFTGQMPG